MAKKNSKGFTLVEIVFVVFLMALLLAGLFTAFSESLEVINTTGEIFIANNAAQEEIANLREMDFDNLVALGSTVYFDSSDVSSLSRLTDSAGTIVLTDLYTSDDLRKVVVTISWTLTDGDTMTRKWVTIITRNGIS